MGRTTVDGKQITDNTITGADVNTTGSFHVGSLGCGVAPDNAPLCVVGNISGSMLKLDRTVGEKINLYNDAGSFALGVYSSEMAFSLGSTPRHFSFYGGGAQNDEVVRIEGEGNVGIGTTAPDYTLDVAGDAGFDEYLYHNGDADTFIRLEDDEINIEVGGRQMIKMAEGATDKITINNGGMDVDLQIKGENDANLIRTDAANDRVGFGTSSPISIVDVAGKIAITSEVSTPSAPSDGQGWLYTKSDGKIYWQSYDISETDLTSGGASGPATLTVDSSSINLMSGDAGKSLDDDGQAFITVIGNGGSAQLTLSDGASGDIFVIRNMNGGATAKFVLGTSSALFIVASQTWTMLATSANAFIVLSKVDNASG